jgi:hypothetical protein
MFEEENGKEMGRFEDGCGGVSVGWGVKRCHFWVQMHVVF